MKWILSQIKLINILNLDVALGASGMAALFNYILYQTSPLSYYYLLFSVVWTIYLLDHLYDSKKKEAVSQRRKFFKKHSTVFGWILAINLVLTLSVFILNFNALLLLYALPAFAISGVYILANWLFQENNQRFYLKEILISIGYSFGIMVIPLSMKGSINSQIIILTTLTIFMALWNLLVIARFEREIDKNEGQTSMSQWVSNTGIQLTNYFIYVAFILLGLLYSNYFEATLITISIFVAVTIYMAIPFIFYRYIRRKERYHRFADLIFLWSFICLFG